MLAAKGSESVKTPKQKQGKEVGDGNGEKDKKPTKAEVKAAKVAAAAAATGGQTTAGATNAQGTGSGNSKGAGKDAAAATSTSAAATATNGGKDGKGKGRPPVDKTKLCNLFKTENGCKFGGQCSFWHDKLEAKDGRCFNCGSLGHSSATCDKPRRDKTAGSGTGTGKGGTGTGKGTQPLTAKSLEVLSNAGTSVSQHKDVDVMTSAGVSTAGSIAEQVATMAVQLTAAINRIQQKEEKLQGSPARSSSSNAGEDLDGEVAALVKRLVQLKTIRINSLGGSTNEGLFDSGATNIVRNWKERDEGLRQVDVVC